MDIEYIDTKEDEPIVLLEDYYAYNSENITQEVINVIHRVPNRQDLMYVSEITVHPDT